ncbi:LacI family DNA-binding transcriptional regulator [Actinopolymorpha pittospori]|uniref:LacI family DNA-binding transcriptional regulator n=1 Tax=Actinopolymorpha pittospori TaxID=648752 RepID=UPI00192D6E90
MWRNEPVSPFPVSRVLGGTYPVASATRARVQRAMRDLDYVVNAHARRWPELRPGRSRSCWTM